MVEYIEREAAIAETRKPRLTDAELRRRLSNIPAADVVTWEQLCKAWEIANHDVSPVRHGRWITAKYPLYACSECDAVFQEIGYGFDYCPNCGAKMDKDGDGDV